MRSHATLFQGKIAFTMRRGNTGGALPMSRTTDDRTPEHHDGLVPRLVVMGVSGSGKSTVGLALANYLRLPFIDGDSLHPRANIEKMSAGTPLTDDDRWPWLTRIGAVLQEAEGGLVTSCSALKKTYRNLLREKAGGPLAFLFLDGARDVLLQRMGTRTGHFMKASMLDSQLATLEPPHEEPLVFVQDVTEHIDEIVHRTAIWLTALQANATSPYG
jgi:gluconokinase